MAGAPTTLGTTRRLRRSNWVRIAIAVLVLAAVGFFAVRTVEREMRRTLEGGLETILRADVAALEIWLDDHRDKAKALAGSYGIRETVPGLVTETRSGVDTESLSDSELLRTLRTWFVAVVENLDYEGFVVMTPSGQIIASEQDRLLGARDLYDASPVFRLALGGKVTVSHPFRDPFRVEQGLAGRGAPVMYAVAPIADAEGRTVAMLGLQIDPGDDFTEILSVARSGKTGETYAFNEDGVMLSNTRFPEDLVTAGLLDHATESGAILEVHVRDPGGNMVEGHRPSVARQALPLTEMAASAISGEKGANGDGFVVNVEGYNDYRGVQVVGAWKWLDDYQLGVATEADVDEAYSVLYSLRMVFGILFGLMCLIAAGTLFVARWLDTARRRAAKAERAASKLGSYTLVKKIGEGGMGEVWLARHTMLRRPTAVKLLPPEKSSDEAVGRFEREVQMTARLSHPNTISIYDYGHTPDGIFYYAMEYLHGLPLDEVIRQTGPMSSARVVHVLKQVCGSLHEAHVAGLIHRDVKPANLMLCEHGGLLDVVKVLDFGLVKNLADKDSAQLSKSGIITGTPMYISPEVVIGTDDVTPAADLYALGAVAYYLLTGRPVFDCTNAIDHLLHHAQNDPVPPSRKIDWLIDPGLETLIMQCLEKQPAARPVSAQALAEALDGVETGRSWAQPEARDWWATHADNLETALTIARDELTTGASGVSFHVALDERGQSPS